MECFGSNCFMVLEKLHMFTDVTTEWTVNHGQKDDIHMLLHGSRQPNTGERPGQL